MGSLSGDDHEFALATVEQQTVMLGPFINQVRLL